MTGRPQAGNDWNHPRFKIKDVIPSVDQISKCRGCSRLTVEFGMEFFRGDLAMFVPIVQAGIEDNLPCFRG